MVGFHAERTLHAPPGLCGGEDGVPGILEVNGRALEPHEQKVQHVIRKGDRIHMKTPGGAGFGPGVAREQGLIACDAREGYVPSPARLAAE